MVSLQSRLQFFWQFDNLILQVQCLILLFFISQISWNCWKKKEMERESTFLLQTNLGKWDLKEDNVRKLIKRNSHYNFFSSALILQHSLGSFIIIYLSDLNNCEKKDDLTGRKEEGNVSKLCSPFISDDEKIRIFP